MSGSREQPASRLRRVPCLPTVSDKQEGCREEDRAAGCCLPKGADNRGSRKNTSFYPCLLCQKPCTVPHLKCLAPVFSFSLTATSHFALILLVFAPLSFLNPKSLFPSQLGLFNCSPRTSLLPTSSLFSCLSITSEHATSQHKPSYTARMTVAHPIFPSFIFPSSFVFLCSILFLSPLRDAHLLLSSRSTLFKNNHFCIKKLQIIAKKAILSEF